MTPSSDMAQPGNPMPQARSEDLLSRDEIDALFDGLGGANPSRGAGYAADTAHTNAFGGAPELAGEPMPFDWQSLPRISRANRGTMPALEVVNQRLLRNLRAALPALLGQHPDVTLQGTLARRYSDFLDETPHPSGCAVVNLRPLAGQGLLVVDLALADVLIDLLHGGNAKAQNAPDARSFASLGQRTVLRLVGVVMAACTQAWQGVAGLSFEFERFETEARHVHIATALDRVYVSVFKVQIGEVLGTLSVCLPLACLAPIRAVAEAPSWGDFVQADGRWLPALTREVQSLVVPLAAHCLPLQTSLACVLALRAGDFIELGAYPQTLATPEGLPLFEGRLKTQSGRQGIQIDRILTADAAAGLG